MEKTKTINGIKYKLFKREELIEKLGMTNEEADIVENYQVKFPQLLQMDNNGFCIDGETLCKELEVKDNFNNWLLRTTKGKEGKLIKYRCIENTDFICTLEKSKTQRKDGQEGITTKNVIKLTLKCAKKIAMRQNNEQGDLVCDYFILMEETLRNYEDWIKVRQPEKEGYKELCTYVKWWAENCLKDSYDLDGLYKREANMLNLALKGKTALQLKLEKGYIDNITRDHFNIYENSKMKELQLIDISLLKNKKSFEERTEFINNYCNQII